MDALLYLVTLPCALQNGRIGKRISLQISYSRRGSVALYHPHNDLQCYIDPSTDVEGRTSLRLRCPASELFAQPSSLAGSFGRVKHLRFDVYTSVLLFIFGEDQCITLTCRSRGSARCRMAVRRATAFPQQQRSNPCKLGSSRLCLRSPKHFLGAESHKTPF